MTNERADARYSLGILVGKGGMTVDVIPGTPATKGRHAGQDAILTVNGRSIQRRAA